MRAITPTRAAFCAFLIMGALSGGCGDDDEGSTPSNTPSENPTAETITIHIPMEAEDLGDRAFGDGPVAVDAGTQVTWINDDQEAHTVTSDDDIWDSGTLEPGESFTFTFATPGEFTYHCELHPEMTGAVRVTEPSVD